MRPSKVKIIGLIVAISVGSYVNLLPARADTIWTCAFPAQNAWDKSLIVQYRQRGGRLIADKTKTAYQILKNNEFGLVAISSTAQIDVELYQKDPTIAATVILIDKHSGEMLQATTVLGNDGSEIGTAQCVHNP
jgi:hypothetical protein